jgi:kynureninase
MITQAELEALDRTDPLAGFRDRFLLPEGMIYLDGNSLGPLPRATPARMAEVLTREWGEGLIRSWNDAGWIDLPTRVGDRLAPLLGAEPGSVVVADSTSVNLYKLLGAALALRPERRTVLSEAGNFPTDLYVAASIAAFRGAGHRLRTVPAEALAGALDQDVAVLMLTHVNYRTGAMHDMAALTAAAHAAGALVLWDLAHSAGAVPLALAADAVDFAVGCGYKFLNGGPGAPAFLYVAPRLHAALDMPISGWLGHAAPFAFEPGYRPAAGIGRAIVGTPPVLSLAALAVGVEIALAAPIAEVRAKSLRLGEVFAALVAQECSGLGLHLLTPAEPARRGSQISFAHPAAYPVMQALIARGVIGDVRAPDILRFGLTPLTLRYAEIGQAVAALREVLTTEAWRHPDYQVRQKVT